MTYASIDEIGLHEGQVPTYAANWMRPEMVTASIESPGPATSLREVACTCRLQSSPGSLALAGNMNESCRARQ